jgi:hypothetical protein
MSDRGSTAPARLDTTIIGEAPIDAQSAATLLGSAGRLG